MKTSPNPTDEFSSRLFTSLLTVLGSNSWRPPWGMEKYLRGRLNWSPFCCHSTDESTLDQRVVTQPTLWPLAHSHHSAQIVLSSLDLRVVTRSTSRHSIDESSFDQRVLTRLFCRHFDRRVLTRPTSVLSQSLGSISRSHSLALTVTVTVT